MWKHVCLNTYDMQNMNIDAIKNISNIALKS